ncbi:MAG: tRNA pseudouridine(38-40) synthase TruA [Burkholderiales bacterium]|nr:tRNA pseudouridine(38-40) synthase TruA [Burkholderiales bacterium]OUT76399.1 MAG: tRNA pseudouridine(38-40) synthase TruA [Betaproteobacteria bacterium TMED22]
MRLALRIEYDGSSFFGWQIQPEVLTIQGEIERGLSQVAGEPIRVFCAGRTDTGVHATYQIVHFDTTVIRPDSAWVRGLNALISKDISILWVREVSSEFHARYSALRRTYRYLLLNREQRPGLFAKNVGWYHKKLDVNAMKAAALTIIGENDFSAFRSSECQANNPVRTIEKLCVRAVGDVIVFEVTANAFLHHMVRNIVGTLVYIGAGKQPVEWMDEILVSRNRALAAPTFSPNGLYLTSIDYNPHWGLPGPGLFSDFENVLTSFDA